jgi:hypothetical protein
MTELERDPELLPAPATLEGTLPKRLSESVLEAVGDADLISKLAVGASRDTGLLPVPATLEGTLPKGLSESVLEAIELLSKLISGVGEALKRLCNRTLLLATSIPVDGPGEGGSVVVILIGGVSSLNTTVHDVFICTVYVPSKHRSSRVRSLPPVHGPLLGFLFARKARRLRDSSRTESSHSVYRRLGCLGCFSTLDSLTLIRRSAIVSVIAVEGKSTYNHNHQ